MNSLTFTEVKVGKFAFMVTQGTVAILVSEKVKKNNIQLCVYA